MSNSHLYPCFQHWPGTVWFYSDPHFGDSHVQEFRTKITDEEQIKRINSKVGKNGTIVFLGDVGDLEFVKKLKGYKVLIMGNHDCGITKYKEFFNEVYEGSLQIAQKIILSHEPIDYEFCLNIHGHDHAGADFVKHVFKYYDADMNAEDMCNNYLATIKKDKLTKLCLCAEWINYTPINIEKIIKSGILHHIPDIHRDTIDAATLRKMNKNKR